MTPFLKGQVCLVTGGAQGVGWAIAQALADHGAWVFISDISADNLQRVRAEIALSPWKERMWATQCDVTDRPAIEAWVQEIARRMGRIDVLVNNAVFVRWEKAEELSLDDLERMTQVGYHGVVYATRAVLPFMQQAGRGHIVNMGSTAGRLFISPATSAYCAVKAAVDAFTQILQLELAQSPVQVTLVRPAAIAGTEFFAKSVSSRLLPRLGDFIPYLTPPQVASAVVDGIRRRRAVVNVPGYIGMMYLLFSLAPGLLRRLVNLGGAARTDFGQVSWRYEPQFKPPVETETTPASANPLPLLDSTRQG